jgi:hypothetical protein
MLIARSEQKTASSRQSAVSATDCHLDMMLQPSEHYRELEQQRVAMSIDMNNEQSNKEKEEHQNSRRAQSAQLQLRIVKRRDFHFIALWNVEFFAFSLFGSISV